jgi:uncharacterized protein
VSKVENGFQIFAKPAGAACNLDCRYCYYLDKAALYPDSPNPRMPEALLEEYIRQHIDASPGPDVTFSWHGGEPTTLGLDYFRRIVALQARHRPPGWTIRNGIQSNGILLDDEWCRFLASERFHVGLSLDGPAELHDAYRLTRGGQPTHARVMRGWECLQKHAIESDIVCVVHNLNARQPLSVYRFFRSIGCRSLGFLPVVDPTCPQTVPADDYGTFLCRIFDEWAARDVGRMMVQIFDEAARPALGIEHSLCVFRETCGQIPVLEHTGDLYPCDHYVDAEHRLGNITETELSALIESPAQRAFGDAKRDALPQHCRQCEVLEYCHGGCPKYRFIKTPDGEPGLNYLCAGLKRFFLHARPTIERLVKPAPRPVAASADRNAPCPCGSGRKFKKCCGAH